MYLSLERLKKDSQIQQLERPLQNPRDYASNQLNKFKSDLRLFVRITCFCIKNKKKKKKIQVITHHRSCTLQTRILRLPEIIQNCPLLDQFTFATETCAQTSYSVHRFFSSFLKLTQYMIVQKMYFYLYLLKEGSLRMFSH